MIGNLILLLQDMNPGKGFFARPYESTQGISGNGVVIFFLIIIAFGLYIGFRVWKSLRDEKMNRK
jgi:hypothetical protein